MTSPGNLYMDREYRAGHIDGVSWPPRICYPGSASPLTLTLIPTVPPSFPIPSAPFFTIISLFTRSVLVGFCYLVIYRYRIPAGWIAPPYIQTEILKVGLALLPYSICLKWLRGPSIKD